MKQLKQTKKSLLVLLLAVCALAVLLVAMLIGKAFGDPEPGDPTPDSTTPTVIFVGELTGVGTEQTVRDGSLAYPYKTMQDAVCNSSDGGIIYVVGRVDINNENPWSDDNTGKSLTIQAYPAKNSAGTELIPQMVFSVDAGLTGNMTFLGYIPGIDAQVGTYTTTVPLKMIFSSSVAINPNNYMLQIGRVDENRELYANEITTSDTVRISSSSVTDLFLKLYTSAKETFTSSGTANLASADIDIVGGQLSGTLFPNMSAAPATSNVHVSRFTSDNSFNVFNGSSTLSGNFNITFDNAPSVSYIRLGNISTAGTVNVNLDTVSASYLFMTGSSSTVSQMNVNLKDSTLAYIFSQNDYNYSDRNVTNTYNHNTLTEFNFDNSQVNSAFYYAVSSDGTFSSPAVKVNFINGTNHINTIYGYSGNVWQFNVNATSASINAIHRLKTDINVANDKSFSLGTQGTLTELHDINLGDFSSLSFSGEFYWLSGDLTCSILEESYITTPKRFDLATKGEVTGTGYITIDTVTGIVGGGASDVLVNIGATSVSEYIAYAGTPATESILTYATDGSRTYISSAALPITVPNTVYVRSSGSDANDGTSYANAVATTKRAYEIAAASTTRKTIVVCGMLTYYFDEDNGYDNAIWDMFAGTTNAGDVTVTSFDGTTDFRSSLFGTKIVVYGNYTGTSIYSQLSPVYAQGAVFTFENVTFDYYQGIIGYSNPQIYLNGTETVFGNGIITPSSTCLYGGSLSNLSHGTNLTVYSGTYSLISGGSIEYYTSILGDVVTNVYGGTVNTIYGNARNDVTGDVSLVVGGVSDYQVRDVKVIEGAISGKVTGHLYVEVSGENDSIVFSTNASAASPIRIEGQLQANATCNAITVYAHDFPGNEYLYVVAGPGVNRTITIKNVDLLYGVSGAHDGYGYNQAIDISITNTEKTLIIGGVYAQAGDLLYDSNYSLGADSFPDVITSGTVSASGTITLENVECSVVCGVNNAAQYELTNITDRNLILRGENSISQSIRQFTNVTSDVGSTTTYNGTIVNASSVTNNGSMTFTQENVTFENNYSAGSGSELHLTNHLVISGKITGATELFANNAKVGCDVVVLTYNATNVPELTYAFYGDGISFELNQPASGNGKWKIDPIPFDKIPAVYVRDTNGAEVISDYSLHDGSDYDHAVYTLAEAFVIADTSSGEGTVVVCGPLAQAYNWAAVANSNTLVITSEYDDVDYRTTKSAVLNLVGDASGYLTMNGNWTIQDLDIRYTTTGNIGIDANGYTLIVGTDATPDIVVDKTEGARRWNGSSWKTVNTTAAYVQPDVTIKRGTESPTNFYVLGGGQARTTVEKVDVRLYNVTVGQLIGMQQNSTVNGDFNVVCRDSFILWTLNSYASYSPALSFCGYAGISNTATAPTGTVLGDASVAIERYMANPAYTSTNFPLLDNSKNTYVYGDGQKLVVNKSEIEVSISSYYNSFANCSEAYYELFDGLDNSAYGFSFTYILQEQGKASAKSATSTMLGSVKLVLNVKHTWLMGYFDRRDLASGNLIMNFGNAARSSMVTISGYPFTDNSSTSYYQTTASFKNCVFNVYPGTSIGGSTTSIALDNFTSLYTYLKGETYQLKDVENGFGKWVFHSSDANPDFTYNLTTLRRFAIEADGCTIKVNDASYVCSGMTASNNGIIMLGEDGNESGWKPLNVTQRSNKYGGNLGVINGGRIVNFNKTAAVSIPGCVTVCDAELDATVEKLTFNSYYASGDAKLLVDEGTTLSIGYLEQDCGTTEVNYVPNTNPSTLEAGATIVLTREGQTEDKFVSGKNTSGLGTDLNALDYHVTGGPSFFTNGILPSEYQKVEYLQSSAKQWIDTELVHTPGNTYEFEMSIVQAADMDMKLFGAYSGREGLGIGVIYGCWRPFSGGYGQATSYTLNTRYDIKIVTDCSRTYFYIDDGLIYSSPVTRPNNTLYLFHIHPESHPSSVKCYSFSAKDESGDSIAYYVPCYRKYDGKPGMYDMVTDTFHPSITTSDFILGPEVDGDLVYVSFVTDTGTTSWTIGGGTMGEKFKIYIKDAGSDSENGGSQGTSVQTLGRAFEEAYKRYNGTSSSDLNLTSAEKAGKPTFYVTVCGEYHLESLSALYETYYDPSDYKIVLTQMDVDDNSQNTKISASVVNIPATFTIQSINIRSDISATELFACGHPVVFGEDISTNCSNTKRISIYGGQENQNNTVTSTNLVVNTGKWYRIYGGNKNGDLSGDIELTLEDKGVRAEKELCLPEGFIEVEYLESTGTQWIDTGVDAYIYSQQLCYETMLMYTNIEGSQAEGTNQDPWFFVGRRNGLFYSGFGSEWLLSSISVEKNRSYVVKLDAVNKEYSIDGEVVSTYSEFTESGEPIFMFACGQRENEASFNSCQKKYWFKIYSHGEMIRCFVPCYRDSDGEPGMYDLVYDRFYPNQGQGEFGIGPKGNHYLGYERDTQLEIMSSSIDTGLEGDDIYGVFGGCKSGNVIGDITINIKGGENYGYVYGGGFGKNGGGAVTGDITINIEDGTTYDTEIQRVYGGGYNGTLTGDTTVNFKSGTAGRIYGGGMMANSEVSGTATVNVGLKNGDTAEVTNYLRGSGALSGVGTKSVLNIKNGAYLDADCDVCAGGYTGTAIESELNVSGGEILCNIYAGSAGEYATTGQSLDKGKIQNNYGKVGKTELYVTGGVISGNVFGGGNKGYVGSGSDSNATLTSVNITGGTISGDIYAGCNLATVYGNSEVTLNGGTVTGRVFGGGRGPETVTLEAAAANLGQVSGANRYNNGALTTGTTNIEITSGTQSGSIYGGCDLRGKVDSTNISATKIPSGDIYGGGYGENTNVATKTTISLNSSGATTGCTVYGGGEFGTVEASDITITDWSGDVFGGGKGLFEDDTLIDATVNDVTQITISGTLNGNVYGGGEVASVENDASILVESGATVNGTVYGGGKGTLNEDHANVASTSVEVDGTITGDVFGGGELASVGATNGTSVVTTVVVDTNASITGTVYGGGKGDHTSTTGNAKIYGDTDVTLNGGANTVFGGGQIAPVAGNTNVTVQQGTYTNVFGGNDVEGEISGTPSVTVMGGTVTNVYGGGRNAAYSSESYSTEVDIDYSGSVGSVTNVYGGGYGSTATVSNSHVTIENGTVTNVYGGGELATTVDADVDIVGGTITDAYAGGKLGNTTNADISVTDGTVTSLYGGGNQATVTESSTVTINIDDDDYYVSNVFAGNNQASMDIRPTLNLTSGKLHNVYLGGNHGVMTTTSSYTFDYPDIEIDNLYAGCNNTGSTVTADTVLTLKSGTYATVYGGDNVSGHMAYTNVIIDKDPDKTLDVTTVYGGGNQADSVNTSVTLTNGEVTYLYGGGNQADSVNTSVTLTNGSVTDLYGGGNNATATGTVSITLDDTTLDENPNVVNLYCGNNAAAMSIAPTVVLTSGKITNFYGGGNQGAMTSPAGLVYTFDKPSVSIETVYGAGNQAGVTTSTTLNLNDGNFTTIYGGSNAAGTTNTTVVNVNTDIPGTVFGGGKGSGTTVNTTNVNILNGTISGDGLLTGNVYGGSGYGKVGTSNVTLKESTTIPNAKVVIQGNVFGGGYGFLSVTDHTNVVVDLDLDIATQNTIGTNIGDSSSCDVLVSEVAKASGDRTGESKVTVVWKTSNHSYTDVSYINGSVFGGSDMGKIGVGSINPSNNIATISTIGSTNVTVKSGYIKGSVFGGGNGQPSGTDENGQTNIYNSYMGNVFGTNNVNIYGGYVGNSVFGCGLQSKTYSGSNGKASNVVIDTTDESNENGKAIVIGESVFGGGNKGSGNDINASVPTTFGDTYVLIKSKENEYAHIYFVSDGSNGGGIYGDGNLSLVEGNRTIDLVNFSCGTGNASRLKTFYSLQRADVVNLIASRVVLKGAVDLVAEDPSNKMYSINRVDQLNMKDSSTIKVVQRVNLFGELTSDLVQDRQFINLGKNNGNNVNGDSETFNNDYLAHGATSNPAQPLTMSEMNAYRSAYNTYVSSGTQNSVFDSINVVAVGNGGSIEIKTGDTTYGAVKGLFTLQLVDAVAGEGGGFIYADIVKSTGNFVCVTKMEELGTDYMYVYQNVGGYFNQSDGRYEYYYWYLRGGKLAYDVSVEAVIGTDETAFEKNIVAPSDQNLTYILSTLTFTDTAEKETYIKSILQNSWDEVADRNKTNIAIELMVETISPSGTSKTSIGYIGLGNVTVGDESREVWGIQTTGGFIPSRDYMVTNLSFVKEQIPALCYINGTCTGVRFYFVLHKGLGITEEFRNYPFAMSIAQVTDTLYSATTAGASINDDALETKLSINLFISAIRVVPSQSAYISSGRLYGGIASTTQFMVTSESSFTAQFITKYVPSAFNSVTSNKLNDVLLFAYDEVYVLSAMETPDGDVKRIGITATVNGGSYTITHIADADDVLTTHYTLSCDMTDPLNPEYRVNYHDGTEFKTVTDEDPSVAMWFDCDLKESRKAGFKLPKNTVVTLLANLNEGNPTYWYYYCTDAAGTSAILLSDFCRMNSVLGTNTTDNANKALYSTSATRVTENLIFIFNFANVTNADWNAAGNTNTSATPDTETIYQDNLMLKHNYTATVGGTFDIMDFILKTTNTENVTTYTHSAPVNTDKFKLALDEKAISNFSVEVQDGGNVMNQSCDFDVKFQITPNNSVINTQYEERRFALLLELRDSSDNVIEFPEGTSFTYNGTELKTGLSNKTLIVPVGTSGEHVVNVETRLYGFEVGSYKVVASLYSTKADGYYNSIQVIDAEGHTSVEDMFTVQADPVFKLKIKENSGLKNRVVAKGSTFNFTVTAGVVGTPKSNNVSVKVYRFANNEYVEVEYADVFTDTPVLTTGVNSWTPQLTNAITSGTYRIELSYNSCTEYWDFIVD